MRSRYANIVKRMIYVYELGKVEKKGNGIC
jgi:hypothetical protein